MNIAFILGTFFPKAGGAQVQAHNIANKLSKTEINVKLFLYNKTNIKILKEKCISDFFLRGDLGWAESYIDGNWETSNLTDFLEWGARNFHEFSKYVRGKWFTILYLRLKHHLKKNSRSGSKKNISFHYDLGNSFYEKWLDESMTYSSAMFKNPEDNLLKGQINKYENLANITGVKENDKILWFIFSSYRN